MKIRKSLWKRITCAVLAVFFFTTAMPTTAKANYYWPESPGIVTPSAIVIEVNSGAVLYDKNSTEVNYPASITKIMTTMLALEYSDFDEIVTFSADAVFKNEGNTSHIARDLGEQMTMEQCLYAVMLESANECAYAVAEHIGQKLGGDYQTFVDLMNERAKELGCVNTHFANANGLPDPDHYTSARDMALIAAEAYKNEDFRIIIETRSYRIAPTNKHDEITPLNNHHAMISAYKTRKYLYEYCTGGKTGYTDASGSTLVSYAEKDGLSLVCVVMRTNTVDQYLETTALFDYCFQNFHAVLLAGSEADTTGDKMYKGIMGNQKGFVDLNEDAYVALPIASSLSDVDLKLITKDLPANTLAQLQYTYGNHVVGLVGIVPSEADIEDNYFEYSKQREEEVNIIKIKPTAIFFFLLIAAGIGVLAFFGKRLYDNYYVIMHDVKVRKQRRSRFKPIQKKKRRRRRRDRMFK